MATRGGCFVGSAFSCVEVIAYLYTRFLRISPSRVRDLDRDYFLLSKGHAVSALYGVLCEQGFFPPERLEAHLQPQDFVYWHPHVAIPGVEFHTGSLGQGLSVAIGVSLDLKRSGKQSRVVVMLGDGELNEGSVWESIMQSSRLELSNLVVVVDRNCFQANFETEALVPLEPLPEKFRAFGANVLTVDGHSLADLERAFAEIPVSERSPTVVIAKTVRGKGIPSIESDWEKWFMNLDAPSYEALSAELHQCNAVDSK